jgi:hypothetical protein
MKPRNFKVTLTLPAVVISRRARVLGSPPCKANDPGIDDAATWQEMPKSIRRRERVERVVPVSMSRFLLSFVSKGSHASSIFQSSFVRYAIRWINLGEVPGVLSKGLSVRRYTVSVKGQRVLVIEGAPTQTEQLARLKRFGHIDARFIASF